MSDVLVLNADYRPLNFLPLSTISWQHAMKLDMLERIKPIEWYENWQVNSAHDSWAVPAIVVTREFQKYKKSVRFSRRAVYLRDLYTCQYCSEPFAQKDLTLDHVLPVCKGGKTEWTNIVTACKKCNHSKSDKIISPIRLPWKPEYWQIVAHIKDNHGFTFKHPSWERYLNS